MRRSVVMLILFPLLATGQVASPEFRKDWKICAASSFEPGEGVPQHAIDGRADTFWHSHWSGGIVPPHPHEIAVDMGASTSISGIVYTARQEKPRNTSNGRIDRYQLLISNDATNWTQVARGKFPDGPVIHTNTFSSTTARYIKLISWSGKNNGPWAAVAELDVLPVDQKLQLRP